MNCEKCNAPVKGTFRLCWRCHVSEKVQNAYADGYAAGQAIETRMPHPSLDEKMIRRLLQLCHPDKHNNSEASVRATQFLLGLLNNH